MSISRDLAELIGGTLVLQNAEGGGTIARLELPIETGSAAFSDTLPEKRRSGAPAKSAKILFAEDYPVNQALIAAMLDQLGYEQDLVTDGDEEVKAIRAAVGGKTRYGLVLMDVEMPKRDGVAATRAFREEIIDGTELPIVALTANAFAEDTERFLAAGLQAHLAKPLKLDALKAAIEQWIRE